MMLKKLFATTFSLALATSAAIGAQVTPDQAFAELKSGNDRYITGHSAHPRFDPETRRATATYGQTPICSVLGCADSRVPPEVVFDQGFARLFVVRVAGNVCSVPEMASIEYAVAVLKVPLIIVLGHTKCGAVQAAIDNKPLPGSLPQLVSMIRPAVESAEKKKEPGDLLLRATQDNIRQSMAALEGSPVIKEALDKKSVKIVGGYRDIHDGHVVWLH